MKTAEDIRNESFNIVNSYHPHLVETEIRDMIYLLHELWYLNTKIQFHPSLKTKEEVIEKIKEIAKDHILNFSTDGDVDCQLTELGAEKIYDCLLPYLSEKKEVEIKKDEIIEECGTASCPNCLWECFGGNEELKHDNYCAGCGSKINWK